MKVRENIIIIFMLLSFAIPAKGDDMTDAVREKLKLQNEKKELLSQLNDLKLGNAKLQKQKSLKEDTIQLLEENIERITNKINPDSLKRIRQIEKVYKKELNTLGAEIEQLKKEKGDADKASQDIANRNKSMAQYEIELIKAAYKKNKALLGKGYSEITLAEISSLEVSLSKFKEMEGYADYEKEIYQLKENKSYYDEGIDLLAKEYKNEPIKKWRNKFESHTNNLDDDHFNELDSLDIKLSRYKGGILKFKEIINDVEKIANELVSEENIRKKMNEYFNSEDIKKYEERYANNIKWLGDRYYNFKKKKLENPKIDLKKFIDQIMGIDVN